jgi:hypothetical protein
MPQAWSDADRKMARQMIALGHSDYAIAAKLGRTRSSIRNLRQAAQKYSMERGCSDCSSLIRDDNITGRCKRCATIYSNSLPEMVERRKAGWQRRLADPIKRARLVQTAAANSRKAMTDPVKRARAQELARGIYRKYLDTPEVRERLRDPEIQAAKGRKITALRLAWCPVEYRPDYLRLIYSKRIHKGEAKAIILAQVEADASRIEARISPFERQDRALARGAKLVANDRGPMFGEAVDHGEGKWEAGRVA